MRLRAGQRPGECIVFIHHVEATTSRMSKSHKGYQQISNDISMIGRQQSIHPSDVSQSSIQG